MVIKYFYEKTLVFFLAAYFLVGCSESNRMSQDMNYELSTSFDGDKNIVIKLTNTGQSPFEVWNQSLTEGLLEYHFTSHKREVVPHGRVIIVSRQRHGWENLKPGDDLVRFIDVMRIFQGLKVEVKNSPITLHWSSEVSIILKGKEMVLNLTDEVNLY